MNNMRKTCALTSEAEVAAVFDDLPALERAMPSDGSVERVGA